MYHMVSSPCVYDPISGMKTLFINYFGRKYRLLQSRFEEKAWSSTWHSVNEIGIVINWWGRHTSCNRHTISFSSQTRDTFTCPNRSNMMILTLINPRIEKGKELLTLCFSNRTLSRCIWRIFNSSTLWIGDLISIELPLLLIAWWITMEFVSIVHSISKRVTMGAQGPLLLRCNFAAKIPFGIDIHCH